MKDIAQFDAAYNSSHEDKARQTRGVFIQRFPPYTLQKLTLDEYVVGHGNASFCNLVESGTKEWANIQGATSFKFGIYYGREKHDPVLKYRFVQRFGTSPKEAFAGVKTALLNLVALGAADSPDFVAIDANPLSQMFKAKILSLYYPKRFLAVCSGDDLRMLADILGFNGGLPVSQYQNLLLKAKRQEPATKAWSEPKFMAYLYKVYVRVGRAVESPIERPRAKKSRRVNFEEMQKDRAEIGKIAEEYALKWEKERLRGSDLKHLVDKIKDRREYPSDGYDFLSYSSVDDERYIEVKSVAKVADGHRFFLSENERETSISAHYRVGYYFYLVYFDGKRNPKEVEAMRADHLYPNAEMSPSSYEIRFDRRKFSIALGVLPQPLNSYPFKVVDDDR